MRSGILARAYTDHACRHETESPTETVEQVDHRFVPVTDDGKLDTLVDLLKIADGPTLVFVRTKRGAARLAQKLERRGLPAAAIHGDLTQAQREQALKRFDNGKVGRWSRPTSPPAASTWTASRTSSTTTRPRTTRATSTASAAPAARAAPAPASRW